MTCFELHISVNQRLQEVASYKRDKYRPEEIDMALNKAMFRILETGVKTKFKDTQIDLSHVAALIHKNKVAEVIIPSINDSLYEPYNLSVYATIPPDLYWVINGRAEVVTSITDCETAPTLPTSSQTEYVSVVAYPAPVTAPYYQSTSLVSTAQGVIYSSPTQLAAGVSNTNSKYVYIQNILDRTARLTNVKVYWERYRDVYYANSFIVVSNSALGTVTLSSGLQSSIGANSTTSYTIPNRTTLLANTNNRAELVPLKITNNLLYQVLKQNDMYRTSSSEVIADQTQDYFILYREESFLISRLYYDYIRKPKTISLSLNQTCELADSIHPKVIDMAVEILRLDIKDQTYPATVQDVQLRTN